jgi:hypothetical protein
MAARWEVVAYRHREPDGYDLFIEKTIAGWMWKCWQPKGKTVHGIVKSSNEAKRAALMAADRLRGE